MHSSCMKTGSHYKYSFYYIPIMVYKTACSHYTAQNSFAFLVLLSVVVSLSLPSLSAVAS